jgi:ribulose 1,5-bisphosphate carboxylase large subunit-like protein
MKQIDWQHIALMVLAIGAAGLQMWKPQLAPYTGALLVVLTGGGILKYSPLLGPGGVDAPKP